MSYCVRPCAVLLSRAFSKCVQGKFTHTLVSCLEVELGKQAKRIHQKQTDKQVSEEISIRFHTLNIISTIQLSGPSICKKTPTFFLHVFQVQHIIMLHLIQR